MYHKFTPRTSVSQQRMNSKLQQVLNHYRHLKQQQPNKSLYQNQNLSLFDESFSTSVHILYSLYNERHNCMVFWLSNHKFIRYDFGEEVFEEVKGFGYDDFDVMDIKLLHIGSSERYLILRDQGIIICTLLRPKSPASLSQKPSNYPQNIPTNNKQPEKMQEQSSSQLFQQQISSFTINTIQCQTFQQNIHQDISQGSAQERLKEGQLPKQYRIRSAGSFIVNDSINLLVDSNTQKEKGKWEESEELKGQKSEELKEEKSERVFVGTNFSMAGKPNFQLVLYELTLTKTNETQFTLQVSSSQFRTTLHSPPDQVLTITKVQFPNNKYFTELAMSSIQIPFSHQAQSQTINPIQVTNSNAKFTRTNLLHECDKLFVTQKSGVSCFSLYLVAQNITHDMEPGDCRHFVFEFRFAVTVKECKIIANQSWGSPMFAYPEREVTCPTNVYCLPCMPNTSILCYINITKTLFLTKSSHYQWQPNSYKFTTITMIQNSKMQFSQIQCQMTTHEGQSKEQKYRHVLEHQHIKLLAVVNEQFIFAQALLIDLTNQYAIILAFNDKVFATNCNHIQSKDSAKKMTEFNIIVVNIRQNLPPNYKRVAAKYPVTRDENSLRPYMLLSLNSMAGRIFSSDQLSIESDPAIFNDSLHLPKILTVLHCNMNRENKKLKGYDSLFDRIDVLPKAVIYSNMLARLSTKNHQNSKKKQAESIQNGQEKIYKYKLEEMDTFFAQIMHHLSP